MPQALVEVSPVVVRRPDRVARLDGDLLAMRQDAAPSTRSCSSLRSPRMREVQLSLQAGHTPLGSIEPVIGAGLDVFAWRDAPDGVGEPISTRTATFLLGGIAGAVRRPRLERD